MFPLARARIALHDHSRGPMAEGEAQFISPDEFMAGLQAMGFVSPELKVERNVDTRT